MGTGIIERIRDYRQIRHYWKMFQGDLAPIASNRKRHIEKVYHCYRQLVAGRYSPLYKDLVSKNVSRKEYCQYLRLLNAKYRSLPPGDRLSLHLGVILHDIGYLEDSGVDHPATGRKIVPRIMGSRVPEANVPQVQNLVGNHGLFADVGVQYLQQDLHGFSSIDKDLLLILVSADTAGKPAGNKLTPQVIGDFFDIYEGKAEDSDWFFRYRLQHLLGPSSYVYVSDEVLEKSLNYLKTLLNPAEFAALQRNLAARIRNMCWPVFQELVLNENGLHEFIRALQVLNAKIEELGNVPNINMKFEPDFFELDQSERAVPKKSFKSKLASKDYLSRTDLIKVTSSNRENATLTFIC